MPAPTIPAGPVWLHLSMPGRKQVVLATFDPVNQRVTLVAENRTVDVVDGGMGLEGWTIYYAEPATPPSPRATKGFALDPDTEKLEPAYIDINLTWIFAKTWKDVPTGSAVHLLADPSSPIVATV